MYVNAFGAMTFPREEQVKVDGCLIRDGQPRCSSSLAEPIASDERLATACCFVEISAGSHTQFLSAISCIAVLARYRSCCMQRHSPQPSSMASSPCPSSSSAIHFCGTPRLLGSLYVNAVDESYSICVSLSVCNGAGTATTTECYASCCCCPS
ncbi:hypothetical protein JG687_00011179 [Phytophthora cactorum]|uniref:Uncharacterized protein n=1 Tax=Phytophthora cactorum TaxID=29920 RepID=A0A8T1U7U9_9STRA|nr:hypothetical protein JG687_00011179 [Phytophthora cactorum]